MSLLAIDPGTHTMGVALFNGERLETCFRLLAPKAMIEVRIAELIAALDGMLRAHAKDHITEVACEKATALEGRAPAPELQAFIRRLRQWTRALRPLASWSVYNPNTIVASVRPRGMKGHTHKEILRSGVTMLYGRQYAEVDQNVIDAIAIGHCHLGHKAADALGITKREE